MPFIYFNYFCKMWKKTSQQNFSKLEICINCHTQVIPGFLSQIRYFCLSKLNSAISPEDRLTANWRFVVKRDNIGGISLRFEHSSRNRVAFTCCANFAPGILGPPPDCFLSLALFPQSVSVMKIALRKSTFHLNTNF